MNHKKDIVDDPLEDTDQDDFKKRREMIKNWFKKPNCLSLPLPYHSKDLALQHTKYCVFHKNTQLDENGLCPDCLEMVKKHTKIKRRIKKKNEGKKN